MRFPYVPLLFITLLMISALPSVTVSAAIYFHSLSGDIPLAEDAYSGIYAAIDNLQSRGLLNNLRFYDRPYSAVAIRRQLQNIDTGMLTHSSLAAFRYLENRLGKGDHLIGTGAGMDLGVTATADGNSDFNWGCYPKLEYRTGRFYFISRYTVESVLEDNPGYRGKKWSGFGGYGNSVYGIYATDRFEIYIGRRRLNWGPGQTGSLVLNGSPMPYDGLSATYSMTQNLRFSAFTFVLDPYRDLSGRFEERYLSGHRLLYRPFRQLTIGLSEIIIYGGFGRNPEIYYAFPLFFLHGAQLNQGRDDNTFIEADFRYYPGFATEVYGQILIDDFQIESKTRADNEPAEYGLLIGLYNSGFPGLEFIEIRTEYVRITNRTYNQPFSRNRYLNRGYFIGHPLGNDADKWLIEVTSRFSGRLAGCIDYSRTRRGEGRVENSWDEPWLFVEDYRAKFPTGVVEETNEVRFRMEYCSGSHIIGTICGWYGEIKNMENISGNKDDYSGFEISLGVIF